jgi:hypothetical protein
MEQTVVFEVYSFNFRRKQEDLWRGARRRRRSGLSPPNYPTDSLVITPTPCPRINYCLAPFPAPPNL